MVLETDGNLHWSTTDGAAFTGNPFAKFRASKLASTGRAANDRFGDPKFVRFSSDWRQPIIYVGWEPANLMPHGRLPSTVDQAKNFEEKVRVLLQMSAAIFPMPQADRRGATAG